MFAKAFANRIAGPSPRGADSSPVERVAAELAGWPGLSLVRPACGPGVAIAFAGCQIVHLLGDHEAELRLGEAAVTRLGAALDDSGQLIAIPSARLTAVLSREEWARIRVDCDNDFSLVLSLASVAIAARENAPTTLWRPEASCPRGRRLGIRR